MGNFIINIQTSQGIQVINPSDKFEPFNKPKGSNVNNAKALVIDCARDMRNKKVKIIKATIHNTTTGKEQVLIQLNN